MAGRLHLRNRQTEVDREPIASDGVDSEGVYGNGGTGGQTVTRGVGPGTYPASASTQGVIGQPAPGYTPTRAYPVADQRPAGTGGLTAGLTFLGLLTILIGAWGGIVPYLGPSIGFHANSSPSWYWNWEHSLLYLIPGATAVVTGLWMWAMAARTRAGSGRIGSGLAALVLLAAGAWFGLGPTVWPIFYTTPVFTAASGENFFLHQLGYNLGPGLVLAALGGMTLAHAATRRRPRI